MASPQAISIDRPYECVSVDLWGQPFVTRPATRSIQKQAHELEERIEACEEVDALVRLLADLLDLRLVPGEGKRTKASTVILRKWEADELALSQLLEFCQALGQAERPT